MNRSGRRVVPLSVKSPSVGVAAPDQRAVPDHHVPSRCASRRGPSEHALEAEKVTIPRGREETGRESPIVTRGGGARRNSMRRSPMQSIFPESYSELTASETPIRLRKETPRLVRLASLHEMIGEEYLSKLRVLFEICDGNSDGELTQCELLVLLRLLGLDEQQAADAVASSVQGTSTPTATFDMLISRYHVAVVACATSNAFPRDDFVLRCKRLKYGFKKIDGDRNQGMARAELEIATQKLDLTFSDGELDKIYSVLDRDHDGNVEWCDFVFSAYYNTLAGVVAATGGHFTIDMFADLPSFICQASGGSMAATDVGAPQQVLAIARREDIRASKRTLSFIKQRTSFADRTASVASSTSQSHRDSANKSVIERIGIQYLTRTSMEHLTQAKKVSVTLRRLDNDGSSAVIYPGPTLPRRASLLRMGFSVHVRRRIRLIEGATACVGSTAGILCGLISIGFESLVEENRTPLYYVYIMLINIAVSLVEVHCMYLTAVVAAFRLTLITNLKLYPQDAEREFLTRAIARAALQVGHRKDKLFGMDPMKDSPRIVLCMSFMVYKTKRYAIKLLLKLLIKRVLWRAAAKSVLSLLVLPINGVVNAWTLRDVMLNCRVSIIGPPCVVSLLETFFVQDEFILPSQRVDYMRILGVSLVCKRCIHPNVEIMIEHMRRQWLKPNLWPILDGCCCLDASDDPCPRHLLDDLDQLLVLLKLYASQTHGPDREAIVQHRRNMFFFFIIGLIIDGGVDWVERSLFVRLCAAAGLQNTWTGVLALKDDFIAGKGIHMDSVMALVLEIPLDQQGRQDAHEQLRVPWRESALYSAQRIAQLLVW